MFLKGDNFVTFCDFLIASLEYVALQNQGQLLKDWICSEGRDFLPFLQGYKTLSFKNWPRVIREAKIKLTELFLHSI